MSPVSSVVRVTGASSGFGALAAHALASAGHTVYASMRDISGRNAERAAEVRERAAREGIDPPRARPPQRMPFSLRMPARPLPVPTTWSLTAFSQVLPSGSDAHHGYGRAWMPRGSRCCLAV